MVGDVAPIAHLMPFYMKFILDAVKTHVMIFVCGPPKVDEGGRRVEDDTDKGVTRSNIDSIQVEAPGLFLIVMYVYTLTLDVKYIFKAFMLDASLYHRLFEALNALTISPNLTTLCCGIGLYGLHASHRDGARTSAQVMYGPQSTVLALCFEGLQSESLPTRLCALPPFLIVSILQLTFVGLFMNLEMETLHMIPAKSQRMLICLVFYTYKPLFHLLMIVALPGTFAFIWLTLPLNAFALLSSNASRALLLPCTLAMRRWVAGSDDSHPHELVGIDDSNPEEGIAGGRDRRGSEDPYDRDNWAWQGYMAASMYATILCVMIPLTSRLFEGQGYMESLRLTWDDRHAVVFFNALMNKFETVSNTSGEGTELCYEIWANFVCTAI